MKEIFQNVFLYEDTCSVYVVKSGKNAILIDFGSGEVLEHLKEIGVEAATDILVTHHHRDQIQGLQRASDKGIAIWVPHQEQDLVAKADEQWQKREIFNNYNNRQDRFSILHSVKISGTLKDYSTFTSNGLAFYIVPTPGHTTGSISIETAVSGKKICFTGDLLYGNGKVWSLAALQWSYNGGEGIPFTILSLLYIKERNYDMLLPSHGFFMTPEVIDKTIENLKQLLALRRHNPRLFLLREKPYENITEHVLRNRTSMADSYVLISKSRKAMIIDFGYDFMAGTAAGTDRSSRRPWLYTIPALMSQYPVDTIDACIPTHYHDDHVAGFSLLKAVYGTKILCPETFADILENPGSFDIPCLWYDGVEVDKSLPLGKPIQWEEYTLILHALPGHTKFAVAIEFSADGKTFLCTGDQYAEGDGLFCNYVYKNKFHAEDFVRSAVLCKTVSPDLILTGHWGSVPYTEEYEKKLKEQGEKVEELHKALLPISADKSDFLAEFYPYHTIIQKNTVFEVTVNVENPFYEKSEIEIKLCLPEGFAAEGLWKTQVAGGASESFTVSITVPPFTVQKERISCNLWINGKNYGQQAELQIEVI